jgi:rod shape-determining protein MreC
MTSGIGNSYPSGYSVGRVKSIDENLDPSFMTVYLEPTQNLNRLELVLIIEEKND